MKKLILSIDQGTTSTRAIAFDEKGNIVSLSRCPVYCLYPKAGWVECNAEDIWNSVKSVIKDLTSELNMSLNEFSGIGITNQRETTIIWDRRTGEPIYHAIIWQSRQSADICDKYANFASLIHERTGLLINPYFSASKIRFILDAVPGAQERAEKGELCFGTVDTWVLYKLTNGMSFATDVTNASRTMLFNIHTLKWDNELCKIFNIPLKLLPEVKPNTCDFGVAEAFNSKTHIYAMAGDQQSSLFGHSCFTKGEFKNTYGTGCFMLMNTGDKPYFSSNGLLTTVAWNVKGNVSYALEGSVFIGGAIIEWLKDKLKIIGVPSEADGCAEISLKKNNELYLVPAFVGLGAPYWDDDARGSIFGITANTTKEDLVRASLEGIAYQCKDVFEVMKKDANSKLKSVKVDGGASRSNYLMQFQSDLFANKIQIPTCDEVTALGVAYMAGLECGIFKTLDDIRCINCVKKVFNPSKEKSVIKEKYKKWKVAVKATRNFK